MTTTTVRNESINKKCDDIMLLLYCYPDSGVQSTELKKRAKEEKNIHASAFYQVMSLLVDRGYVKKRVHQDDYRTVTYSMVMMDEEKGVKE